MSRSSLLLLALLILHVLLGCLCLAVARGERRSRALWFWGWGLLVYAAGILVTIPTFLPFDLRKVVGNAMIALAPVLCAEGLVANSGVRLSRRWVGAAYLLSILPIVVNHLRDDFVVLVDLLSPSPIALVLFTFAAVVLLRRPPPDARNAARYLAGLLVFTVLVWLARNVMLVTSVGATNDRERADLVIALFAIAQLVTAVGVTLGLLWVEVRTTQAAIERVAFTDALTGLLNRRATVNRFAEELSRAARLRQPLAMVLFDIDHFKRFNDTHGHQVGDAVLVHVATLLSASIRTEDVLGRIGGEELLLVLGGQPLEAAYDTADRLRDRVATTPTSTSAGSLAVTLSGGVAVYPADGASWDELFTAADARLYKAKRAGRNRVVGASAAA